MRKMRLVASMTICLRLTKKQKSGRQARRCLMSRNVIGEQVLREGLKESLRNLYSEKVDLESIFSALLEIG